MAKAKKAIPDGYHTVTPSLTLDNAAPAIDWYEKALGAQELSRAVGPDGKIMHAEILVGNSRIMVNDAMMGMQGPQGDRRVAGVALDLRGGLRRPVQPRRRGRRAGVLGAMGKLQDQFWGDRWGSFSDPHGYLWTIATHKEDLSPRGTEAAAGGVDEELRPAADPRLIAAARPGAVPEPPLRRRRLLREDLAEHGDRLLHLVHRAVTRSGSASSRTAGSRARRATPLARHASRNAFAGRPMLTNMKLACESVGFMPRSANHFMVKSRTSLLRARSAAMNDASCWIAAMPGLHREHVERAGAGAGVPLGHLLDRLGVADGVSHAQARHAVGLRERARDDDVRVLDRDRDVRVVIGIGDVVEVRLVDEHVGSGDSVARFARNSRVARAPT